MNQYKQHINSSGQALITLLFFMIIAITITTTATAVLISNMMATTKFTSSIQAYYTAESGVEDAVLQLLRNPSYVGTPNGQPLTIDNGDGSIGTATITVAGVGPYTITSVGQVGNFMRKVQATVSFNNGTWDITDWKEVP